MPHAAQRYPTVGDYQTFPDGILVTVSAMSDWRYEALVAVHELVEKILVDHRKIPESLIDSFDIVFEELRQSGDTSEPGDHPSAPYRDEHRFATLVERLLAKELGVSWAEYEAEVQNL